MRTVKQFVADLVGAGKTKQQIVSVARSTQWSDHIDDVREILRGLGGTDEDA